MMSIGRGNGSRLAVVFCTLLLDVTGIALILPVLPVFLEEIGASDVRQASIQAGLLVFTYSLMQFFLSPLLGALSDKFGRRPVLLFSIGSFAIDNFICAIATSFWMLLAGRTLAGISGASIATCSAYIADVSDDKNRMANFGLIGLAIGLGFVAGPILGGVLGAVGPRVPFIAAAVISMLNLIAAFVFLPESLPEDRRRPFQLRRAHPLGALRQTIKHRGVASFMVVYFFYCLAQSVWPSSWAFVTTYRFGWDEQAIGLSLGIFGVGQMLVIAFFLPKCSSRLGDQKTGLIGLAFATVALAGYGVAWEPWMIYGIFIFTAFEFVSQPALRALASKRVPPDAQGELQGALGSVGSLTSLIGPIIYPASFSFFTGSATPIYVANAPFLISALFMFLALVVYIQKVGFWRR